MREFAEKSAKALDMNRERLRKIHAPKYSIPEPKVEACPHCGKGIPFSVTDLPGLSAADLRSMADRKEARATVAAAHLAAKQQLSAEEGTASVNRRRRRDDAPLPQPTTAE